MGVPLPFGIMSAFLEGGWVCPWHWLSVCLAHQSSQNLPIPETCPWRVTLSGEQPGHLWVVLWAAELGLPQLPVVWEAVISALALLSLLAEQQILSQTTVPLQSPKDLFSKLKV